MISLNYAEKMENGYILNFYADTAEDIESFDPTAPFMFYGAPLPGSIVTLVSSGTNVNYFIDNEGSLVAITGGDTKELIYDLDVSDFTIEAQSNDLFTTLSDFTFSSSDTWSLDISGADGVEVSNITMVYEEDEKEGDRFITNIGEGDNVGNMSASITEAGVFDINTKNEVQSSYFSDLSVKIYKVTK